MYICAYICIYIDACMHMYIYIYICVCVCMCICAVYVYICICTVSVYVYVYTYVYRCTHRHIYIYIYIHATMFSMYHTYYIHARLRDILLVFGSGVEFGEARLGTLGCTGLGCDAKAVSSTASQDYPPLTLTNRLM